MTTKSEEIRQFLKDHPDATNAEVVEELLQKGVFVSLNLINQVRYDYKHKKKQNFEDRNEPLLRVKQLADELGGVDRLIQLAELLKKLIGEEGRNVSE